MLHEIKNPFKLEERSQGITTGNNVFQLDVDKTTFASKQITMKYCIITLVMLTILSSCGKEKLDGDAFAGNWKIESCEYLYYGYPDSTESVRKELPFKGYLTIDANSETENDLGSGTCQLPLYLFTTSINQPNETESAQYEGQVNFNKLSHDEGINFRSRYFANLRFGEDLLGTRLVELFLLDENKLRLRVAHPAEGLSTEAAYYNHLNIILTK